MISVSGHNWEELTVNKRILEKFRIENSFRNNFKINNFKKF